MNNNNRNSTTPADDSENLKTPPAMDDEVFYPVPAQARRGLPDQQDADGEEGGIERLIICDSTITCP